MVEPAPSLVSALPDLFAEAARRRPWPGGRRERTVRACGRDYVLYCMPWRAERRGPPGTPPLAREDVGARIIGEESIWRSGGLAITPNRYPFAEGHLLLWEEEARREPSRRLLEMLCRICREDPELLGMVNSMGAAATVTRAHAQVARLPRVTALARARTEWGDGPGCRLGRPAPGAWPAGHLALAGEPAPLARLLHRLLLRRLPPAYNLVVKGERAWFFGRRAESCPRVFPLPLGALELAGAFAFEEEEGFAAMTGAGVEEALAWCGHPGGWTLAEAAAALAGEGPPAADDLLLQDGVE